MICRRSVILSIVLLGTCAPSAVYAQLRGGRQSLAPVTSPVTITMPDGSTISRAASQVLVYFARESTPADQQAVIGAASGRGAQLIGQLDSLKLLQFAVSDPSTVGTLILNLRVMAGVSHAGPVLFLRRRASACDGAGVGPDPRYGATGWLQAGNFSSPRPSAAVNDVVMVIIDDFANPGSAATPATARHGDVVAAYAIDAGGLTAQGDPVFQLGRNVIEVPHPPTTVDLATTVLNTVAQIRANNPGKKIVVNYSAGPDECSEAVVPGLITKEPAAVAACVAADTAFYNDVNQGLMAAVAAGNDDQVLFVGAAANTNVALPPQTSIASCRFIPVTGLDQTYPAVTRASFAETAAVFPIAAPACNISPVSLRIPPEAPEELRSGNSFAAPQVAGQLAALWAANPTMSACQMGSQVFSLPKLGPSQTVAQFNGQALATLVEAHAPALEPIPTPAATLECPAISVAPALSTLAVGGSVRLTPTLTGGGAPVFEFQSSNPRVASVDATGLVTVRSSGIATISVSEPGQFCAAQAAIIVPSETYVGTFTMTVRVTLPPDADWAPNPAVITATTPSAPLRLVVTSSLLSQGSFNGFLTQGPGSVTVTIPTQTCVTCDPPLPIPGSSSSSPFAAQPGPTAGVTDGRVMQIPMPGFPPMRGNVSVLASTTQVSLTWSFQTTAAGSTVSMQMSGTLTRQ